MFQENGRSLTITEGTVFVLRPLLKAIKLGCFNKYFPSANKNKQLQLTAARYLTFGAFKCEKLAKTPSLFRQDTLYILRCYPSRTVLQNSLYEK